MTKYQSLYRFHGGAGRISRHGNGLGECTRSRWLGSLFSEKLFFNRVHPIIPPCCPHFITIFAIPLHRHPPLYHLKLPCWSVNDAKDSMRLNFVSNERMLKPPSYFAKTDAFNRCLWTLFFPPFSLTSPSKTINTNFVSLRLIVLFG